MSQAGMVARTCSCIPPWYAFLLLVLVPHQASSFKQNLSIPVLVPMFNRAPVFNNDRFAYKTTMSYAFDLINKRDDILPEYNLVPEFFDTGGSTSGALMSMMNFMYLRNCNKTGAPPAIIGPAFSAPVIAVASLSNPLRVVQFSYAATTPMLDMYHYVIQTVPGTMAFNRCYVKLMETYGWKRAAIIFDHHQQGGIFNENTERLIGALNSKNLTVVSVESFNAGTSSSISTSDGEIRQRLQKLKALDVKIIFGQFNHVGAYRIFCQAYKLGMYGKSYVWIVHFSAEWAAKWMESIQKRFSHLDAGCTEEQLYEASEGMIFMDQQSSRPDNKHTISGLTSAEYDDYVSQHRPKPIIDIRFHNTTFHSNGFDSVWTMALTLNNSVEPLRAIGRSLHTLRVKDEQQGRMILSGLKYVQYEGITGPVAFNKVDAYHRPIIGTLTLNQHRGKKFVRLGNFEVAVGELHLDPKATKDMWIDGKPPLDRSYRRTVLRTVPLVLYTVVTVVAGLGILLAFIVLFFNVYNRNNRLIRKSAPMFNNIIVLGIVLCLSAVAFFGLPVQLGETDKFLSTCKLRSWFLCLGFSLAFGSMFVKTWRVYKIFTNRKLKYSIDRLSNTSLFVMIISIVVVDIAVLLLWDFLDPSQVKIVTFPEQIDPDDSNTVLIPVLYTCHSAYESTWNTTIYTIKGILLLYGLFLAYETRNVQFDHLNDSRMIGVCVYNVAVMSVLGALLKVILSDSYYKESFGITSVCIIFPSLGTLLLIFLPKGKRLILGIESSPSGYSRASQNHNGTCARSVSFAEKLVVRFVRSSGDTENTEGGVVYEGPGTRSTTNSLQLRKCSVDSEGITSLSSSLPCSNSRYIMPIYEEATSTTTTAGNDEPPATAESDNSRQSASSCSVETETQ